MEPTVIAVSARPGHHFSKTPRESITLIAGIGVEGDGHAGETVKHRSRVRANPDQPNLRQVHLIHAELFDDLRTAGHDVQPGDLGENITTRGVDLLDLPVGAVLRVGPEASVELTGLRNPCRQIDAFQAGLLRRVVGRDDRGRVVRKSGVMGVVVRSGAVRPGDPVVTELPTGPHRRLDRV